MQKHLNLTQCKQFSPCAYTGGHSVLYAIRFTLPAIIDKPNAYIQDNFFDECGEAVSASGFFKWLPINPDHHNDTYFAKNHSDEVYKAAYAKGVSYQNGFTVVDLMFITSVSGSISDELSAINSDLNQFVSLGLAINWEQISFFPFT
jgi:hypothetical protein